MIDGPDNSPNVLRSTGRRGAGVRRLNRIPLIIAAIMLLLIGAAVIYTYQMRLAEMRRRAADREPKPEPANISELFSGAPSSGLIEAVRPERPAPAAPAPQPPAPVEPRPLAPLPQQPQRDEAWEAFRRRQEELAAQRANRLRQAITAPTKVAGAQRPAPAPAANGAPAPKAPPPASGQLSALFLAESARQRQLIAGANGEEDINRAEEKRAFLTDRSPQSAGEDTLAAELEEPASPYEVKAGTVIPAIMIGGVISDLPGQILGQVSENVYDTATGRHILIPQGSKLVGSYDNAVTTGQERVLVAWTRIIYPDAASIDLGKMPGTDASGYAGFHDKVDTHFWKMFGNALMLSVFSAGVQISQGGQNSGADGLTPQQTIAAGLGQQLGELGEELARRNSRIQPTLEIRPGYRYTVMVTKDMRLRPWRKR
jgi:type IV secretory pathway VirB10-like protein